MIARTWHGRVPAEKAEAYFTYLQQTGLKNYRAIPGNRGVYVLQREDAGVVHFLLISLWESMDAIKAFAGDAYEKAVYYPEDKDYLLEFEPHVTHYEVLSAEVK